MLNFSIDSLTSVMYSLPALFVFVFFILATIHLAQEEVSLKKSASIILVSSVYMFCLMGLFCVVFCSEELASVIDKISFRLLVTLVLYASSPISMFVSMLILFIVHAKKVGLENV